MNGRPRSSTRTRIAWRKNAEAVAWLASKASGCTCEPDVKASGRPHVQVRHDDDCPMVNRGTQMVAWGGGR